MCFNSLLQELLKCKLCDSSFSTALELEAHCSVFYKGSNGGTVCPAAASFGDGLLRYQQTGESVVQATTTTVTTTTPMNSVQQQSLPSINSISQQQEQHPEQQQQNIQDSNDSVMIRTYKAQGSHSTWKTWKN